MGVATGRFDNAVATGSELFSLALAAGAFEAEAESSPPDPETGLAIAFEKDFLRWMLSDGAGAVWLSSQPRSDGLSLRVDWIEILSYAGEMPVCMYRGLKVGEDGSTTGWQQLPQQAWLDDGVFAIQQNVRLLNKNIITYTLEKPLTKVIPKYGLKGEDIEYYLPHYSSEFFRDRTAEGMERVGLTIDEEKWFTNLTYKGNTGAASIFIMLEELYHSGKLNAGDRILCGVPESGRFSTALVHLTAV